jgi:transposase
MPESLSSTTSPTTAEPEFAAFVGLDWADQKHCWQLRVAGSSSEEPGEMKNTPEAMQTWAAELYQRFQGRPIAVCLEQSRGAVAFQLSKFPHLVLYPVHPTTAAHYRQAFFPSGSKNDPGDTKLLLELVVHHRDRLRRLDPDTPATRLLQWLVEHRRKLVDEKTRVSNRLTAWLKTYFPQVLDWIDDIDSPLGCALLARWPTLEQLQRAHPGTLRQFFRQHNCRRAERIEQRIQAIYQATPAVNDGALLQAGASIATSWVTCLQALQANITRLDGEIAAATAQHPDAGLFAGAPGAGPVLNPRLIAAFGSRRDRYTAANQMESYSGIAPVTEQSGRTQWVHVRRACPKFLRQTFHEFAAHSLAKSVWARAYYDSQIAAHKGHHAAVRALAFKWIRVLFRCWQDRKPYDEQIYSQALEKRNSPLAKLLSAPTGLAWTTVGSFQKLSTKNT